MNLKTYAFSGLLAVAALASTSAHAATPIDLNTGVDTDPANGVDDVWDVDGNDAVILTAKPSSYTGPPGEWISTALQSNGQPVSQGALADDFSFTALVDLSSLGNLINWSGTIWVDNLVKSISIGGQVVFSQAPPATGTPTEHASAGVTFSKNVLLSGDLSNTDIEIVAFNAGGGGYNPTSMRLNSVMSAIPEPGTWMLMILGLGAVGFSMRRRRQNVSARLQFA